jgi:hypothetical protein
MIRSVMTALVLSMTSVAFAQDACNTKLTLNCEADLRAEYQSLQTLTASDSFSDEHWDEPSLANCASTVYMTTGNTTVRVSVEKDLSSNALKVNANASQITDYVQDGQKMRRGDYSNFVSANAAVGQAFSLATLKLALPLANGVTDVDVKCVVK